MCVAKDTSSCNGTSHAAEPLCEMCEGTKHVNVDVRILRSTTRIIMWRSWRLLDHSSMEEMHIPLHNGGGSA